MMKQNDSFAEPRFPVRSYGKGELAMYYLPGIAQQTAVNRLNEWIRTAPGLEQRLLATGMNPYCRRYTPAQVQLMINVFGEPSYKVPPFSHKSSPPLCLYAHAMPRFQDWHIPPLHALHQNELKQHIS